MKLRQLLLILIIFAIATGGFARGNDSETLGDKIKNLFAGPSPTPHKKKTPAAKKKSTPKPKPAASASPAATVNPSPSSPPALTTSPSPSASIFVTPTQTPSPASAATPIPTPTPEISATATAYPAQSPRSRPHAPLIEPVRPINPGPHRRRLQTPPPGVTIPSPAEQRPTPIEKIPPIITPPTPAPIPPSTAASPSATSTPTIVATPPSKPTAKPSVTPVVKRKPTAPATISVDEIAAYGSYSANARKLLDLSLGLTTRDLGYKYGSADPGKGGMDCSGFIHYVLTQIGFKDAPRDAREQYVWVRKAGTFQAVLAHRDDSFELDALKPGDLLFWSSTYFVGRDPAITETMIYLGREKKTNQRIMVGASEGKIYQGHSRIGVSVFDFTVAPPKTKSDERSSSVFVGYAHIPGFKDE